MTKSATDPDAAIPSPGSRTDLVAAPGPHPRGRPPVPDEAERTEPERTDTEAEHLVRLYVEAEHLVAAHLEAAYRANYYQAWLRMERRVTWRGVPVLQTPQDMLAAAMLLQELQPGLVIETGTARGGMALFLAEAAPWAEVWTIDVKPCERPVYPRIVQAHLGMLPGIRYLTGSSVDPAIVAEVAARAHEAHGVVVFLDSDHEADHVYAELCAYAPLVEVGGVVVVEDTNITGPADAVARWLAGPTAGQWIADPRLERFGVTFHPGGWLRRVA